MPDNHDRPVTITLPAHRARKIAAGLYGAESDLNAAAREETLPPDVARLRANQCHHVARLFEEACSRAELPGTEESALGKL